MSNSQTESHPKAATIARPRQPGTKPVDAYVPDLMVQDLAWGTPEQIEESTKKLYEYAEAVADEFIRWYARNKGKWHGGREDSGYWPSF